MAIYAISAALIIILCLAVAFFLRFSWFTPLEQLIEQLYGRQEKDRTENKTIEKLERAIRFAIKRQQNHDSEEVERLNELLSEVESQHKEKQAHQVEERSKLEALHQEIQDEKVYLGAVQDLSEHALRQLIGAVNRGGERAEVTKAAENISFLLAEKQDTGTRSTENILELIDNVFQLLAPLLSRYQCRFHVVPDLNSPANLELAAANFRRILFRLILDYLRPDRKGNHKLEFTYEADSLNLNFSRDFTPQISLALDDRIAESGADWRDNQLEFPANLPDSRITAPVDCGLTALVIADDEYERESLAARLNLMGLGSTTDFKSELLDICLVSDESSDTYLSIKHYLPETTWVVLLNSRTVINRPYWIQLADPITQAELTTAIEHIGHARDESRLINALVVDDSTANAKLLALQLTELGHSVSKAESGREAIQKVAEESFQIIFMDIQMPDMNGVEATRRIREFGSKIPVFGLTAHATSQEKKAYR
ncbi:MAG: response regulator, partial [Gammaproteobacteria bacterium]|nr:response regulator [Gammaproteobacteria bacterium]